MEVDRGDASYYDSDGSDNEAPDLGCDDSVMTEDESVGREKQNSQSDAEHLEPGADSQIEEGPSQSQSPDNRTNKKPSKRTVARKLSQVDKEVQEKIARLHQLITDDGLDDSADLLNDCLAVYEKKKGKMGTGHQKLGGINSNQNATKTVKDIIAFKF